MGKGCLALQLLLEGSSLRTTERNLRASLALHFEYYNLCRVHQTIRVTPAMEAGITDHVWNLSELLA